MLFKISAVVDNNEGVYVKQYSSFSLPIRYSEMYL